MPYKDPEKELERSRQRREYMAEYHRIWRANNRKKYNEYMSRRDKNKMRVRATLNNAIRLGMIYRPTACSRCAASCQPEAHHPDYDKPLDVIWLCKLCHGHIHRRTP